MKKLLLAVILTLSTTAYAGWSPLTGGATANAVANAHASAKSLAVSTGGRASAIGGGADVSFNDRLQIPNAPSLSSGSSNTTAENYKFRQRQYSTILGGRTTIDMELDIIGFLKFYGSITDDNTRHAFDLAACIESEKWRKLRQQQGAACAN